MSTIITPDDQLIFNIVDRPEVLSGDEYIVTVLIIKAYLETLSSTDIVHHSNDNEATGNGNLRQIGISTFVNNKLIGKFCCSVWPSNVNTEECRSMVFETLDQKAEYMKKFDQAFFGGQKTIDEFWSKNPEKYDSINRNAQDPEVVAAVLFMIFGSFKSNKKIGDNRLLMRPSAYDWDLLNNLFVSTSNLNPFGFGGASQVLDMGIHLNGRAYPKCNGLINFAKIVKDVTGEFLPHDALEDSIVQYQAFTYAQSLTDDELRIRFGSHAQAQAYNINVLGGSYRVPWYLKEYYSHIIGISSLAIVLNIYLRR